MTFQTLFPFVVLGVAVGGFFLYQRSAITTYDRQYANFRAGELAVRLGLTLVEGDPAFNLYIRFADARVRRGSTWRPVDVRIRMQGVQHGVPLALSYHFHQAEAGLGLVAHSQSTWFDCRLAARAARPFPPFEVVHRGGPDGNAVVQTATLPAAPTGVAALDSVYLVSTGEPMMARVLAEALPRFASFQSGLHLVGDGATVAFVMSEPTIGLLQEAEQLAAELCALARRVGG